MYKTGLGQDSHRFLPDGTDKPCVIGGIIFSDAPGLDADSDGDVIFHSICNAITSVTHVSILGEIAPKLCKEQGITDSKVYLDEALKTLSGWKIAHIALSIEGKRPRFQKRATEIRTSVAEAVGISVDDVGITFTSGDELTAFGCGEGLQCFCVATFTHS